MIPYSEVDRDLKKLLMEFGPSRRSYHPEYPFWRLKADGIWELNNVDHVESRKASSDAKKTELFKYNVHGGFPIDIYQLLSKDHKFSAEIASRILETNFPASIHDDILQALGLDIETIASTSKIRDPRFRDRALSAYEYQCAVCGFNVRVGDSLVALEAAHIKWHQAGGPDQENNGIALCSMHHKLFDRGGFTITSDMRMKVSEIAYGTQGFNEWLMAYHGKEVRRPQRPAYYPEPTFVNWHVKEVFRGFARHIQ